jgi:hypothetical protein
MATLPDYAGIRQYNRSRATGTMVGVYHAEEAGLDPYDGPWAVICEDHGAIINVATLAAAKHHAPAPHGWCDECREAAEETT